MRQLYETMLDLLDAAEVTEQSDRLIQRVATEMLSPPPDTPALVDAVRFLGEQALAGHRRERMPVLRKTIVIDRTGVASVRRLSQNEMAH